MNFDPPPVDMDPETRTSEPVIEKVRNYPKSVWLMLKNETSPADKPAAVALALSVLALILSGGVVFAVIAWIAALLLALVPPPLSGKSSGTVVRLAKTTAFFIPLFIISLIGMYIAPILGVVSILVAAARLKNGDPVGRKSAGWAIGLGAAAAIVGIVVSAAVSAPPQESYEAKHSGSVQSSSPAPSTGAPALPQVEPSAYKDEKALTVYEELKLKGYRVRAVFEDRALTDKYGDATDVLEGLIGVGEKTAPEEDLRIGGLSQSGDEMTLTIVARPKPEEKEEPQQPAVPDGSQGGNVNPWNPQPQANTNLPLKAICNDGTVSYQDNPANPDYRGMCSHHRGIAQKLGRMP